MTVPSAGALQAVIFDLYGTLVSVGRHALHREVRRLGASREAWSRLARGDLLKCAFTDDDAFVRCLVDALAPGRQEAGARCRVALQAELSSIHLEAGARSLLTFLKRRGLRLGVLSNLASPYAAAFRALGLADLLDAVLLSCDEGVTKPAPEIYTRLLGRLAAPPERTLSVGDSLLNDVETPAALGMKTVGVGVGGRDGSVSHVAALGLWDLSRLPLAPLVAPGGTLEAFRERVNVGQLAPVEDDEQGRYNIVFRAETRNGAGRCQPLYLKRFLFPETAHLEAFAYGLQKDTGLDACRADVVPGRESLLAVTEAPGRKLDGTLDPAIAFELGKHFVFALLFANADIRPRNAFLDVSSGRTVITLVDLEHCFFNLAIDTDGLAEPLRPETFDRMAPSELKARTKTEVLSRRATSRARRSFFGDTPKGSGIDRAFRDGFVSFYERQRQQADDLCHTLSRRIREEPPLVIGTRGYRRALARVDVADMRTRLLRDPAEMFEWAW